MNASGRKSAVILSLIGVLVIGMVAVSINGAWSKPGQWVGALQASNTAVSVPPSSSSSSSSSRSSSHSSSSPCTTNADCNDDNRKTRDVCKNGVCENKEDSECSAQEANEPDGGSCDDGNDCTSDRCVFSPNSITVTNYRCEYTNVSCGCIRDSDCNDGNDNTRDTCNARGQCEYYDDSDDLCDDDTDCETGDSCVIATCDSDPIFGGPKTCGRSNICCDDVFDCRLSECSYSLCEEGQCTGETVDQCECQDNADCDAIIAIDPLETCALPTCKEGACVLAYHPGEGCCETNAQCGGGQCVDFNCQN